MSQRLKNLIQANVKSHKKMLSLYLTAGYPDISLTLKIIRACQTAGVDFIELGIPFSDPIADGPTIQKAADRALRQGVHLNMILEMVRQARSTCDIPIILMGYLNPVFQFGLENFFRSCAQNGVDGLILPDWPLEESQPYLPLLEKFDLDLIHLIAPNTPWSRIEQIDRQTTAFVYCTAYTGVTGQNNRPTPEMRVFLNRLSANLKNPFMIGFGVRSKQDFDFYTQFANGVIVGSAFINFIDKMNKREIDKQVNAFVRGIKG